jgi:DNA-binding IclR family transcriptional regulator
MTSTYRYINTLAELGYLDKNAKTKEIRPAAHCLLLCTHLLRATDHLKMIREIVDRTHRDNNISIDVAFVTDDALMRVYHRDAEETLTYRLPDVAPNCLHNTALGKAYLASLPEAMAVEKIAALTLVARTGNTIVDKEKLLAEIRLARQRGFALCREEYLPGLLAIGAPLYDAISGIGIGAVSFDFSILQKTPHHLAAEYGDMIRETAATLSGVLYPDPNR